MNEPQVNTRLIPCTDWPKYHPWPSVAGLRWLIFNAKHNGFDKVIRRVSKRVLIDELEFFAFVKEKNKEIGVRK
jgi:hypothetical protein